MTPTHTINIISAVEPTTANDSFVGVARWLVHPVDIRLVGGSNPPPHTTLQVLGPLWRPQPFRQFRRGSGIRMVSKTV